MPAAAIVGLAGVAGSIYSAKKQSDAAKDAARAQTGAAQDSNKLYWDMYQQSRSDNEPFRQNALTAQEEYMQLLGLSPQAGVQGAPTQQGWTTGQVAPSQPSGLAGMLAGRGPGGGARFATAGLGGQQLISGNQSHGVMPHRSVGYTMPEGAIGVGGGSGPQTLGWQGTQMYSGQQAPAPTGAQGQQAAFDRFRNTPGYQFGLDEGRGQLESSAAARGGLYSGAAMKALARFGNDYADQQGFSPYMNRLASLAGMGQTINQNNASMGFNTAQGMGQNLMAAGNARASGLYGRADAASGLASNISGIAGMLGGMGAFGKFGGG